MRLQVCLVILTGRSVADTLKLRLIASMLELEAIMTCVLYSIAVDLLVDVVLQPLRFSNLAAAGTTGDAVLLLAVLLGIRVGDTPTWLGVGIVDWGAGGSCHVTDVDFRAVAKVCHDGDATSAQR